MNPNRAILSVLAVLIATSMLLGGAAGVLAAPPASELAAASLSAVSAGQGQVAGPSVIAAAELLENAGVAPQAVAATPHLRPPFVISAIDIEQHLPQAAYNWKRKEYLVVWHNQWPIQSRDIQGARVSVDGRVLATFTISEGLKDRAQPAVAYDSARDRYLVVWIFDASGNGSDWDVFGRFVPWNGPSGSLPEFPICTWDTKQWNPQVTYGLAQDEFMVVWWTEHPSLPGYVSGRRVWGSGGFPATGFLISSKPPENRVGPDIAYNLARNEYLVVYHNGLDIFGTRLRGDGNILGGGEFGIAGWPSEEINPSVAACDKADRYLVGWQSRESGNFNTYARYVDGNGAPASVHQIDARTLDQRNIDVSCNWTGRQFMLAWEVEYVSHKFGIWARTVSPAAVFGPSTAVYDASWQANRTDPAIAGGHGNYLVVWAHEREGTNHQDIWGRLVAPTGVTMPLFLKKHK